MVENKYEQLNSLWFVGSSLESIVIELLEYKERNKLVCFSFNGTMLYSDKVTIDSAYMDCFGITKEEFDRNREIQHKAFIDKEKQFEKDIPKIKKELIELGQTKLKEKYLNKWNEFVEKSINPNSLYKEQPLKDCLPIIAILDAGESFEIAKTILEKQKHSGGSHQFVCFLISNLCERGETFAQYVI